MYPSDMSEQERIETQNVFKGFLTEFQNVKFYNELPTRTHHRIQRALAMESVSDTVLQQYLIHTDTYTESERLSVHALYFVAMLPG